MKLRALSLTAFGLLWLAAPPLAHGANAVVSVTSNVFTPAMVTINEGEMVTWNNTQGFHNVRSDTDLFTSGPVTGAPWTYSHTFATAGTYPYYCVAHGAPGGVGMSGVVEVVPLPTLTMGNVAVTEGNAGTTPAVFTVTLSAATTDTVTVMFNTIDVSAQAGSDYTAVSTLVSFASGVLTQTVPVTIAGDAVSERNETFTARLTSPMHATIPNSDATGTILDDDESNFFSLAPCRVVDTRLAPGPGGGPALPANTTRAFPVSGLCGVPLDAKAVTLNVTAVNAGAVGDFRIYPADAPVPSTSTINFAAGKTRANNAVVVLGTSGMIAVQNDMPPSATATAHVVIDVSGYFKAVPGP